MNIMRYHVEIEIGSVTFGQEHPLVKIMDVRVKEDDLVDGNNFAIMQPYIIHLFKGVSLPHAEIISCKEHRVAA